MLFKPVVVDISHHNVMEAEGFAKLEAAGYRGVIQKATEGVGLIDKTYAARRRDCLHQSNLKWGAYHFARNQDAVRQADHFLEVAQPDDETLLVLDWESAKKDYSDTLSIEGAKAFLDRLMEKTGRPPQGIWIYGGNVLKELITKKADIEYFARFPLWLCQYGKSAKLPKAWSRWTLWQYTGDGAGPEPHFAPGVMHDRGIDNNIICEGFDWGKEWGACRWAISAPAAAPIPTLPDGSTPQGVSDLVPYSRKLKDAQTAQMGVGIVAVPTAGKIFVDAVNQAKGVSDAIKLIEGDLALFLILALAVGVLVYLARLRHWTWHDFITGRWDPSGFDAG